MMCTHRATNKMDYSNVEDTIYIANFEEWWEKEEIQSLGSIGNNENFIENDSQASQIPNSSIQCCVEESPCVLAENTKIQSPGPSNRLPDRHDGIAKLPAYVECSTNGIFGNDYPRYEVSEEYRKSISLV